MGCTCTKERITVGGRRFYIIKRLGEGGFSVVDQVEDGAGDKFALKRIQCHGAEDERQAKKEAEYHCQFKHKNLIGLEEWGSVKGKEGLTEVLLVLPLFKRGTLQDELDKMKANGSHMPEDRIWRIFRGICEGIKALHSAKPKPLAHRDMKPGNVMLSEDDTPVIMDFGSMGEARIEVKGRSEACALQDLAAEKCSMLFRAPELFHVDSHCIVDEKVDIWSLGCVLFNMAFLHSPFEPIYARGDSIHLAVLSRSFKFPENSRYSQGLLDAISGMLVVEALERPHIDWVMNKANEGQLNMENRI
ncbi:serine/threonine-protein kinase 16-like isoform X1 [Lytechinus pictus]|uniref:serine/threonine-protein kinase 16-like isoform X1 n=1 Tax=Lytechinus pictus TaxID=7653 RepID=UPI0030B9CF97